MDFTVEVERSLRILDSAIGVFLCSSWGTASIRNSLRQADRYRIPRIAYINKMDRIGADYYRAVDMINNVLGSNAVPIQLPVGAEDSFNGIIDILKKKAFIL